jgi:hypothetical protein
MSYHRPLSLTPPDRKRLSAFNVMTPIPEVGFSGRWYHLLGVVGRAVRGTAVRAGEAATGMEVYMDVEATCLRVKLAAGHRPWRCQRQRKLQQVAI